MCRAVKCSECQKTTWSGCGQHVEQVMANVPRNSRCVCESNAAQKTESGKGFFARLFGR